MNDWYAAEAKKNRVDYTDEFYRDAILTEDEKKYFWRTVDEVLDATGFNIPVYMFNHDILPKTCCDALGIHWKSADGSDEFITVDTYFIHESYDIAFHGAYNIDGETLVSVLCHELAHIRYQRHTKYHADLTEKYIEMVEQKEANK